MHYSIMGPVGHSISGAVVVLTRFSNTRYFFQASSNEVSSSVAISRQDASYSDPVSPFSRQPVRHLFEGALKHVLIQVGLSLFRLIYLQIFVHILHKQERFVAGLYSGHLLIPLHSQSAR